MELPGAHGLQQCLRALKHAFPALRVTTASPIEEGWANYVLEINGNLIFKFPRRPDILSKLATEVRLLPELSKVLPLPIPSFDYTAESPQDDGPTFVGYPKIPGQAMFLDQASSTTRRVVAKQLGAFLTVLHRFSAEKAVELGILNDSADAWHREYKDRYSQISSQVLPLLKPAQRREIAQFWESFLNEPTNFVFAPVLVHRDLGGDNVCWDPASGTITGVIDWEAASLGDPAIDFANEFRTRSPSFTKMMLSAYGRAIDPGFLRRAAFYSKEGPVHEVLFGLQTGQQTLVTRGLQAIQGMLVPLDS